MTNRILIITNVKVDADTLEYVLKKASDGPFEIERATKLADGLSILKSKHIDAVLVDLFLPDSRGIDTFFRLFAEVPYLPILTLSSEEDESLAREAVQRGSQGYLSKGHFASYLVPQSLRNLIQRKAVEESLYIDKARAEITLNSISDAVIGTDMNSNVDYLNLAAERMTQWSREEARGRPISDVMPLINSETRVPVVNPITVALSQAKPIVLVPGTIMIRRDGSEVAIEDSTSPIHDSAGRMVGAVIVYHDITAAKAMAIKMAHLAQHDFLTNLPNRVLLTDRIAQAIGLAKRRGTQVALLFLDLDNFKHINDSLGHATGDKLLQSVAKRLVGCVRGSDTVSRQGGDEFVILLTEEQGGAYSSLTADKILAALAAVHSIANNELHVTTSIGISIYPADGSDAETLIKNADTAMYQAKEKGRNNFQFFKNEMNIRAVERQVIEANLRYALERKNSFCIIRPRLI
ncbi:diguanylate cyclase domain-containing protein [Undibacterium sp. Xuan67W]|uniref:diguanylate cyclase domain-containing protein n=1 Tax=Undibacterium sp. Xuan67W TaxID=3413057 RepID=UPI003BF287F6